MKSQFRFFTLFMVLGAIALFLSSCSPAPYDVDVIEKIGVRDNIIYVRASRDCSACYDFDKPVYYASMDNGQTWENIAEPTSEVLELLDGAPAEQTFVCLSTDLQVCYRVNNEGQIDISRDGGISWQTDWQIPVGRKYFMDKAMVYPDPDFVPTDLKIVETSSTYIIVAAMGNQGVLVKASDGNWNRVAVGKAEPTPYYSESLSEASDVLFNEALLIFILSVLCFIVLSVCVWLSAIIKSSAPLRKRLLWSGSPFVITILFPAFLVLAIFLGLNDLAEILYNLAFLPLLGFVITWIAVLVVLKRRGFGFLALLMCAVFSIILYFGVFLAFQLWAIGTIAIYETATTYGWIIGLVILCAGIAVIAKLASLAVKPIGD